MIPLLSLVYLELVRMVTVSLAGVLASTLLALASASPLPEPQFQFGPFLIHSVSRPRHHHTQQRHYTSRHKRQRPRSVQVYILAPQPLYSDSMYSSEKMDNDFLDHNK